MILGRVIARRNANMATPTQLKTLLKYGYSNVQNKTFTEASNIISEIAKNGWKKVEVIDV